MIQPETKLAAGKVVDPITAIRMLPDGDVIPVLIAWLRNEHGVVFMQANFERARLIAAFEDRPVRWSSAPIYWDGYRLCLEYGGQTIYIRTAKSLFR